MSVNVSINCQQLVARVLYAVLLILLVCKNKWHSRPGCNGTFVCNAAENINIIGADDATTCHILILRHSGSWCFVEDTCFLPFYFYSFPIVRWLITVIITLCSFSVFLLPLCWQWKIALLVVILMWKCLELSLHLIFGTKLHSVVRIGDIFLRFCKSLHQEINAQLLSVLMSIFVMKRFKRLGFCRGFETFL